MKSGPTAGDGSGKGNGETVDIRREIPVVADVDVVVAGAGIAGCMTAVAAARNGASVLLIDRFADLGGNMGPGLWGGGVLHLALSNVDAMHEGLKGLAGEFLNRCAAYVSGQLGYNYFQDSQVTVAEDDLTCFEYRPVVLCHRAAPC